MLLTRREPPRALFGAMTWMFAADVAVVSTDGTELSVRGLKRRRTVSLLRARVAVDYKPGGRMPRFVLAITGVMRIERRWREQVDESQQVIDAYYESATWRRVKYGGLAVVLLYIAVMAIYIRLWGS